MELANQLCTLVILMVLPSPKEVRRCSENNGRNERKNHLFLPSESKIWQTLTLSRSEHAHTHGK
jgi:hypothetical protein